MKEVWSLENRKVGRVEHTHHLRTQLAAVGGWGVRGHPQLQQDGPNQPRLHDTLLKKRKRRWKRKWTCREGFKFTDQGQGEGAAGCERQARSQRHSPGRSGELGSEGRTVGCPQPLEMELQWCEDKESRKMGGGDWVRCGWGEE